ncbi:MAG: ATP-binding cassette domain-containing protein, partial [Rhodanobacteraceae bacterium]
MATIEAHGLRKAYGTTVALDNVDLRVQEGRILGLIGPNGAGKTTTIEILEGYRRPDRGSARVLGLDPHGDHAELMQRAGLMLQRGGVYP